MFCLFTHAESPSPRMVMTWVPPYGIDKCRTRLHEDVGGLGPKDALTHLALQFWIPTRAGRVEKTTRYGEIGDAVVIEFRDWAHQHGIRAMLCVYNSVESWDWTLAQAGFAEHREEFVRALVAEMERLGLDGIDIDLEGSGDFESSKESYLAFIRDLAPRVHGLKKQLTVDSFAYKWNAPNQTWWADLFPQVDGVNSVGYERIGANATEWRAYAAQKAAAGDNASKLLIGLPGSKADWLGNTAAEHMDWITKDSSVGVAIWDARFTAPYWQTPDAWKSLAKMRAGH
jgi:hypothetical protein